MEERFLHFIWKHRLFNYHGLQTCEGHLVEVIDPGKHNHDAGPDFQQALIKLDGILMAGSIEIHTEAKEWFRHNHERDPAYNNVILHVVYSGDTVSVRSPGNIYIPTLVLQNRVPLATYRRYTNIQMSRHRIPCHGILEIPDKAILNLYSETLLVERLLNRHTQIEELLTRYQNDWDRVSFIVIGRSFGLPVNGDNFQSILESIDPKILRKHCKSLYQTEALLIGQAGFLEEKSDSLYFHKLQREYRFLQSKFNLSPVNASCWKKGKMRPASFPLLRLAQLASLFQKVPDWFNMIVKSFNVESLSHEFEISVASFWERHHNFKKSNQKRISRHLGKDARDNIIINSVIPLLFSYGHYTGEKDYAEKSIHAYRRLSAEKNSITKLWEVAGWKGENAGDSQAQIELMQQKCSKMHCLHCRLGIHALKTVTKQ